MLHAFECLGMVRQLQNSSRTRVEACNEGSHTTNQGQGFSVSLKQSCLSMPLAACGDSALLLLIFWIAFTTRDNVSGKNEATRMAKTTQEDSKACHFLVNC